MGASFSSNVATGAYKDKLENHDNDNHPYLRICDTKILGIKYIMIIVPILLFIIGGLLLVEIKRTNILH